MKPKNYETIREKHPTAVLLFRENERYYSYEQDIEAVKAATIRVERTEQNEEYFSFRCCDLDNVLPKLIRAGHRVAICDKLS